MDHIGSDLKNRGVITEFRTVRKHDSQADTGEDGYPVPNSGVEIAAPATAASSPKHRPSNDVGEILNYFGIQWLQPHPEMFLKMREAHKEINLKLSLLKS